MVYIKHILYHFIIIIQCLSNSTASRHPQNPELISKTKFIEARVLISHFISITTSKKQDVLETSSK